MTFTISGNRAWYEHRVLHLAIVRVIDYNHHINQRLTGLERRKADDKKKELAYEYP